MTNANINADADNKHSSREVGDERIPKYRFPDKTILALKALAVAHDAVRRRLRSEGRVIQQRDEGGSTSKA